MPHWVHELVCIAKGLRSERQFFDFLRHFLVEVHEWMALLFIATIVIHIILHWTYVRNNLKKYSILK